MSQAHLDENQRALVALTLIEGLGPVRIATLLKAFDRPENTLNASAAQLQQLDGFGTHLAQSVRRALDTARQRAADEIERCSSLGAHIVTEFSAEYPRLLRLIPSRPPLLYVKGQLQPNDELSLAIVGSRSCSAYGIEQAERFAGILARQGVSIISGGARGIDTAAHRAAVRAGGRTVAVLGCGLASTYPPENAELFERVAANGAVVSELPLDTPPDARNFPARNRIISGLSLVTLVVEAGKRSGALITARLASEDHGRDVLALPGRVDAPSSVGVLELIRAGGAELAIEPAHAIDALQRAASTLRVAAAEHAIRADPGLQAPAESAPLFTQSSAGPTPDPDQGPDKANEQSSAQSIVAPDPLTPIQRAIIDALAHACTLDELVERVGMPAHAVRAELTMLEMLKRVERKGTSLHRRLT